MKVLHTADIHLGLTRFNPPGQPHGRLGDLSLVLDRFVLSAREHNVDLAIIAGDLFDGRNPKPRELAVAARFVSELADLCPVVITPGNHDGPAVIADPSTHTIRWLSEVDLKDVYVALGPEVIEVLHPATSRGSAGGSRVAYVVALPYPHKRAYDLVRPDLTPEERHVAIAAELERAIGVLYEEAATAADEQEDVPVIFAGHLTAVGSVVGSERTMRLEDDVSVGSPVLDLFDYAALGHIHKQQRVGSKAYYPGSPEYVDFGEAGQPKGFLLAEVERGKLPVVTVIDSKPRPMVAIESDTPLELAPSPDLPSGAIVRLRLAFADRVAARAAGAVVQAFYDAGASYVEADIRIPEQMTSSDRALAAGTSPLEAVAAYLKDRGLPEEPYLSAARELMT